MSTDNSQVVQPKIIIVVRERRGGGGGGRGENVAKRLSPSLGVRWTHLNPKSGSNVETCTKRMWESLLPSWRGFARGEVQTPKHVWKWLESQQVQVSLWLQVVLGDSHVGVRAHVDWVPTGTNGRTTWAVASACPGLEQTGSWVVGSESCQQPTIRHGVRFCITLSHWRFRWRGPQHALYTSCSFSVDGILFKIKSGRREDEPTVLSHEYQALIP